MIRPSAVQHLPCQRDGKVLLDFDLTVRAFAEATVRHRTAEGDPVEGLSRQTGQFLLAVHSRMPDYLRLPFRVLTLAFDAWAIPKSGRPFHRLPVEKRLEQMRRWRTSRIETQRRLIEFYESLALFGLYSDLYGQDYTHARRNSDS